MRNTYFGVVAWAALFCLADPREVAAAAVFVSWQTNSSSGALLDPAFATNTLGTESFAEAGLTPGTIRAFSHGVGAAGLLVQVASNSGIQDVTLTNSGAAPICFGGAPGACPAGGSFPFDILLDATFANTAAAPDGFWEQTLIATLRVSVLGAADRVAMVTMHATETWIGGVAVSSDFTVVPYSENGGLVTLMTASPSALEALLSMPAITLGPGESMGIAFQLRTFASGQEAGFSALVDSSSTAQLRLVLPAGATLTSDATAPLQWVTVPEPAAAWLLGAGSLGLVAIGRRRRQRS